MTQTKKFMIVGLALSLGACATSNEPFRIDHAASIDEGRNFQSDYEACSAIAYEELPEGSGERAAAKAAKGAAIKAGVGAVVAAIFGGNVGRAAAAGAAIGAATGAVSGSVEADIKRAEIVEKCLEGRGYSVVASNS